MPDILVTLSTFSEYGPGPLQLLQDSGCSFELNRSGKRMEPEKVIQHGRDSSCLIAGVESYDAQVLGALPQLKCISRCGAGVDNIDLASAKAKKIAVFNTPTQPVDAVAELTVMMMLALLRRLPEQSRLMRSRQWNRLETHLLGGKTVGIIGLGKIGRRVAEILRAFGCRLMACDPAPDDGWAKQAGILLKPVEQLLAASDIVTVHAAQTSKAPFRLAKKELRLMKDGAILINCARGDMVGEAALIDALKSGKLSGAGLDVFETEPYSGELTQMENVVLTPHCATLAVETRMAMETEAVNNAIRFLRGETNLPNRVI